MKTIRIVVNRLNFKISSDSDDGNRALGHVLNILRTNDFKYNPKTGRYRVVDETFYYLYDELTNTFTLPITILKDTIAKLLSIVHRDEIEVIRPEQNDSFKRVKYKWKKTFILRDYQEEYVKIVKEGTKPLYLIDLQTGQGKAQPLTTNIRILDGWKQLKDINVGDKVLTQDGTYTKVIGYYPQGKKDIYEITFSDGRKTRCCGEHLWKVFNIHYRNNWMVKDTHTLYEKISKINKRENLRWYVPLVEPEQSSKKDFFIDPYVLGVILGDGSIVGNSITLTVSSHDVIKRVSGKLKQNYFLRFCEYTKKNTVPTYRLVLRHRTGNSINEYVEALRELGLMGLNALHKFIPEIYLNGSVEQRWELLRGLIDTDGYIGYHKRKNPNSHRLEKLCGNISYSTSSDRLRDGVIQLIRSLGGLARYNTKYPYYTYKGQRLAGKPNYNINIRLKTPSMCCTRPDRKSRLNDTNQYSEYLKLRIMRIEKLEEQEECACIAVKHPSKLYVTNDYIVTHNTSIAARVFYELKYKVGIFILPKYINKWIDDIKNLLLIEDDEFYVVQGGESLYALLEEDNPKYKIYIFSIPTMQYYIANYESKEEEFMYPITPDKLCSHLDIGIMFNDETHQHFHALSKLMLYSDAKLFLGSTATLRSNDRQLNRIYRIFVPESYRISNIIGYTAYVTTLPVMYRMELPKKFKYKRAKGYNHILFEQSMMSFPVLKEQYYDMVLYYLKEFFFNIREKEDKVVIYFASIAMCVDFTKYIKKRYKKEKIIKYTGGDDYHDMLKHNIIISNVNMLGTAVDIPNLITVIQTVSIGSVQANLQNFGRLRKLGDRELHYVYFYCKDIKSQVNLHFERIKEIEPKSKATRLRFYEKNLFPY